MDKSTIYGGLVLYILTTLLVYTILANTQNKATLDKNNNKSTLKTILLSGAISLVMSGGIVFISIKVDKEIKTPTK